MYVTQVWWTSAYTFAWRSLQDVYMRSCMCSLFHLALGNEDGEVQLVYESTCCLAWGFIFYRRKDRGVVCVFSIFNAGGTVCVCECVYTHTHTHTAQVLGCEPRSRDETPGRPEESRWTKSRHTHICICAQSAHVCMEAGWDLFFLFGITVFSFNIFFLLKRENKRCERKPPIISFFLSFFLGFRRPNTITGLSGWQTPD